MEESHNWGGGGYPKKAGQSKAILGRSCGVFLYNSDFTDDIVDEINKLVGNMIKEDFVNHKAFQYDPLITKFGELIPLNPPSYFQWLNVHVHVEG